jgi:anti-sigma B factor antagonist
MKITKTISGADFTLLLSGRIDTITCNLLDEEIDRLLNENCRKLILDFAEVDYISSAGLRVILAAQKKVSSKNLEFELTNLSESINNIFNITGFSQILKIV